MRPVLLPLLVGHRLYDLLALLKVLRLGYAPVAPELLQPLKLLGRAARIHRNTMEARRFDGLRGSELLSEGEDPLAELTVVALLRSRVRLGRKPDEADGQVNPDTARPGLLT